MTASPDWTQFVLDLPMSADPGDQFEYCNGASFLLTAILEKQTKTTALDFARKHLFAPLGIRDARWASSPRGINTGYANMLLTPHDMAKFGWLYLKKGQWEGRQIVPADWVEHSTGGYMKTASNPYYGYQWWLDGKDYYSAQGHRGQYIFVVPKHNLVAVFTGNLANYQFFIPQQLFNDNILVAIEAETALPENPDRRKRLETLVNELGKGAEGGIVWTTADNGVARDGAFVRRNPPAFRISYPAGSRKMNVDTKETVMRMRAPAGFSFGAEVFDIPNGLKLSEVGPKTYAAYLLNHGSDIKAVSNVPIKLDDGTEAYRTKFHWKVRHYHIRTFLVSAFRDDHWVTVFSSNATMIPFEEEGRKVVDSLTFQLLE